MRYVIEVDRTAEGFIPRLRSIAASVDPDAVVESAYSADYLVARGRDKLRFITLFVFVLSAVGLMLAPSGLHALVSFTVSRRTREIGFAPHSEPRRGTSSSRSRVAPCPK